MIEAREIDRSFESKPNVGLKEGVGFVPIEEEEEEQKARESALTEQRKARESAPSNNKSTVSVYRPWERKKSCGVCTSNKTKSKKNE